MPVSGRSLAFALTFVASASAPVAARAADRTFTVEYTSAKGCPTREQFVDEIRRRTAIARLAGPGEQPEVAMRVRIDKKKGKRARGKLDITIGTVSSQRELEDASCNEVGSALALVAALAIDPLAETALHLPPLPLPPDPHVPGEVGVRPAIPEPKLLDDPRYLGVARAKVPVLREIDLLVPTSLPAFPTDPPPKRSAERSFRVGPGVEMALDVGPGPTPLVGFTGVVGVRSLESLPWSLRAELTYSLSTADSTAGGLAGGDPVSFRFLRGRFEGCIPAWRPGDWFRLWPCASLSGGAIWGEARRTVGTTEATTEATSPWFAFGAAGRVELAPTPWLDVTLRAGPDIPIVRGVFRDENQKEVFAPSPVGFSLGAGAALAF